jgi:two-component system LytT family sensor kinase
MNLSFLKAYKYLCLLFSFVFAISAATAQESAPHDVFFAAAEAGHNGRFQRSIELFNAEISKLDTITQVALLAKGHKNLGRVHESIGDYANAMIEYHEALKYYKLANDKTGEIEILNNFGYFYEIQFNFERAQEYYQQALTAATATEDERSIANCLTALGSLKASFLGDFEGGMLFLDSAKNIYLQRNEARGLAIIYNELAKAFGNNGKFVESLEFYRKSYQLDLNSENTVGQVISENNIAGIFFYMQQYDSCFTYIDKALEKASKLGMVDDLRSSYRILAYVYKEMGEFDKSFEAFEQYLEFSDSVLIAENMLAVKKLHTEYESDLKDQEIESLHQKALIAAYQQEALSVQSEKRKKWLMILIGAAIVILLVSRVVYSRNKHRQRIESLRVELDASEQKRTVADELRISQIKAIKAQMNPHFIFNVLSSVQHSVLNQDSKSAMLHLSSFSELMRNVLRQSEAHWISLKDELQLLQNYTDLESLRFKNGIAYTTSIELPVDAQGERLDLDEVMIPSLLIQPLIENAVKHGLNHENGNGAVELRIEVESQSMFRVTLVDNGIGCKASGALKDKHNSGMSLGMNGVKQRLNNIYKITKTTGALSIEDLCDDDGQVVGTCIRFLLPFVLEDQVHLQKELIV